MRDRRPWLRISQGIGSENQIEDQDVLVHWAYPGKIGRWFRGFLILLYITLFRSSSKSPFPRLSLWCSNFKYWSSFQHASLLVARNACLCTWAFLIMVVDHGYDCPSMYQKVCHFLTSTLCIIVLHLLWLDTAPQTTAAIRTYELRLMFSSLCCSLYNIANLILSMIGVELE